MTPRRKFGLLLAAGLYGGVFIATSTVGGLAYFHFANPRDTCATCHEMTGVHSGWSASAHRTVHCRNCHGGALTLDVHALESHLGRVVQHFAGDPAKPIRLKEQHVSGVHESCRQCHPQAFADWESSRHATTYGRIFLDETHNRTEPPTNDCLRCHGMFWQGDIAKLVTAPTKSEPWSLRDPAKEAQPAVPCLACHEVHAPAGGTQLVSRYDRREQRHFSADLLPVASVTKDGRPVKVSRDPRQRVCQQCHAPSPTHHLGSSDDRTPAGVHEGLSCRDCHWSHSNSARASCSACHPADSHCGLDVQKMDTTFLSSGSKNNIHTVACQDCHLQGIPPKPPVRSPAQITSQ